MNLAQDAIEALDFALAEAGQDVEMYRIVGTGPSASRAGLGVPIRAHVRTLNEHELTAGLTQNVFIVILSPTSFEDWPPGVPEKGDKVMIDDVPCNVEILRPIKIGDTLVRVELKAKG